MNMKEIRSLFPGANAQVYFDVGVRGLLSTPVREAADRYLEARMMGTGDKAELVGFAEGARESFAALINADRSEVALTKNVSEGLNLFAASLPWEAGDNVIVCPELEHPNNVFLWYNLERLHGIEVRTLEPDGGRVPTDRMVSAIDARTRLVTVPHITFAPGFITDLEPLRRSALEHSALLLVDAAQSVGAIDIDVKALDIDALAVATQKCLLGFYGFGFLWVRRSLADKLKPGHVARYGIELGLPVAGGAPGEHLAHIVSVGESGGGRHYTADDPKMNELYDHLTSNGVRLSIRRGVLRMSLGIYNDEADVDRVVALTQDWLNKSERGGS
jgi:cysteine desulfurase/selenocysteine lyase